MAHKDISSAVFAKVTDVEILILWIGKVQANLVNSKSFPGMSEQFILNISLSFGMWTSTFSRDQQSKTCDIAVRLKLQ